MDRYHLALFIHLVTLIVDAPWILAPAAGIFAVVLAVNLIVQGTGRALVQLGK